MGYKLDHVAIGCKDLKATIAFYENLFGGKATEFRMGSGGYGFCYIKVNGVDTVQLLEATGDAGLNHYGFVADNLEAAAEDFITRGQRFSASSATVAESLPLSSWKIRTASRSRFECRAKLALGEKNGKV